MAWKIARHETVERGLHPDARRLTDLSLAMIVPWRDGFPQYWLLPDGSNTELRMRQILDATENETLPWER